MGHTVQMGEMKKEYKILLKNLKGKTTWERKVIMEEQCQN
jgi:hypothetical protein